VSQTDTVHAWWSRLRHQGLLLSPVVMVERYPTAPPAAAFPALPRLRDAQTRFASKIEGTREGADYNQAAILGFVDALLENFVGLEGQVAKQHDIPEKVTAVVRIANRSETICPHRVIFADPANTVPAVLVMADTSPQVGRGRGRTAYARFLELLRGTGHRLGLLTNGQQFRLIYAGLDFESWCEWESDHWFDDGQGTEELRGLRQLLSPESLAPVKSGISGLLDAVEESRKRQADLSSVLRENVRQAVELLLEEVSTTNRTNADHFTTLKNLQGQRQLTDAEAHEALLQAAVRVVMRLVVCLFAESRQLLPVNDPIFAQSYGVRSLYELLDEVIRCEGGTHALFNRETAWPRLMALFRLIHGGSAHGAFPLRPYGGVLFRAGDAASTDPVARALHILEHSVSVGDATIYYVLRKLLRGPLPVIKGRSKTFVEGPVDYTDLRTEFIGLIYEGLLDYRLKRTDEQFGPQVFLNLGREPVLPLKRLEDMLANDKKGLKDLLTTLKKEKVTASASEEEAEEEVEEDSETNDQGEEETSEEPVVELESETVEVKRGGDYLDAVESATNWAKEAVILAGLVGKQLKRETDAEYQNRVEAEAKRLIRKVVAMGEFYLVRAGNTRKGTGTFYTRPQLAVPTTHRTLQPKCYDKDEGGVLVPKEPETILGLKVCDPACGSASFLVAALHYLTDALYKSLCLYRKLDDPEQATRLTLPYGRPRTNGESDRLVPFPPNDPQRGHTFEDRVKALLRRHVVERCIYGVDINPLAVEFARVSLWVETLDPELPFSFLDHKIKVGNSLVGCWLDRVEDYPLKAWEREGGDGKKGERTARIEEFLKGERVGNRRSGDGRVKREMRAVIESRFSRQPHLFPSETTTTESIVAQARAEYEQLHDLPINDPDERERFYRTHIEGSQPLRRLKAAMDEWCAVWFWPSDEDSLRRVPTPLTFHTTDLERDAIVERVADTLQPFHWELEFPEVFSADRYGFDAMIGNPPWETAQPNPQEFFTDYDPLFRTYGRVRSLQRMEELFESIVSLKSDWIHHCGTFKAFANWVACVGDPFGDDDGPSGLLGRSGTSLMTAWRSRRSTLRGVTEHSRPFRYQTGRVFTYKLFLEQAFSLLASDGQLGMIVPAGIYSDKWAQPLRMLFLVKATWRWLYGFENRKRLFNIHTDYPFACIIVGRSKQSLPLQTAFREVDVSKWESASPPCIVLTESQIRLFSPESWSIPEIRRQQDLSLLQRIYKSSLSLGQRSEDWDVDFSLEIMMNVAAKDFPSVDSWAKRGWIPDVFGRWLPSEAIGAGWMLTSNGMASPSWCQPHRPQSDDVVCSMFEGVAFGVLDPFEKAFIETDGQPADWTPIPHDAALLKMHYAIAERDAQRRCPQYKRVKVLFRDVTNSTNERSMIACVVRGLPCGNTAATLHLQNHGIAGHLLLAACLSSLAIDFATRQRLTGKHLNWFIAKELPIPNVLVKHLQGKTGIFARLVLSAARLTLIHRRFAPEWLDLQRLSAVLSDREWKEWWAVTEVDRLRLRIEIDAICAELYGLDPDDFDWIIRDEPTDLKGFFRVDRQLPFRERLTGLAAAAFRALKDGKWSAESAATLSNDEFFDILGIPELTSVEAAQAKGLPGPLILKRDGCHEWHPERFPESDPRHGWTWEHCRQDAIALLGSEEALEQYLAAETTPPPTAEGSHGESDDEPFQLKSDPPKPRQKKLL